MPTFFYDIKGKGKYPDIFTSKSLPEDCRDSVALFCPRCGEIWGRIGCEGKTVWSIWSIPCCLHPGRVFGGYYQIPGSVLDNLFLFAEGSPAAYWPQTLDYLPDAVIQREFLLHLNHQRSV